MLDENVGFAIVFLESGSPNSLLFKTLDGGETWDTLFFSNYFNKMFVFSEDLLYICANNNRVWKYDGNSFSDNVFGIYSYYSVFFSSFQNGWICGSGGNIHKTTDGGENWTSQTSNVSDLLLGIYAIDDNRVWICGDNGTLLYTNNGGTNWQKKL